MTPIAQIVDTTGVGKSMTLTYFINRFFEITTNNFQDNDGNYYSLGKVYATFHVFKTERNPLFREQDFHYTPIGILPLHKFENDEINFPYLVVIDDSENITNNVDMKTFLNNTTSWHRKLCIDMYLVGHYDKDVQKRIRNISQYRYVINLVKKNYLEGALYSKRKFNDNGNIITVEIPTKFIIQNIFDDCKDLYNTREIGKMSSEYLFNKGMLEMCKGMNREQLENTINVYIKDKKIKKEKIEYYCNKLKIYE